MCKKLRSGFRSTYNTRCIPSDLSPYSLYQHSAWEPSFTMRKVGLKPTAFAVRVARKRAMSPRNERAANERAANERAAISREGVAVVMCRCRSRSRCRGRAAILWLIQHLALLVEQEQNMSPTTSGVLLEYYATPRRGKGVAITRGNDIHGLRLLEEVFGRHRERKLCGLRPLEVVPARRPARRRHTFARRHALYGGALYGGTLYGGTLYGGKLNGACTLNGGTLEGGTAADGGSS
jgi:hypothetical protein